MSDLTLLRSTLFATGLLAGPCLLPAEATTPPVPLGPGFPLAVVTAGNQAAVDVAGDGAGGFLAVWASPDGDDYGIVSRRFLAPGVPAGSERQVNSWIDHNQQLPRVARLTSGDFVVVWSTPHPDDPFALIRARRLSGAGVPLEEIDVHTTVSPSHLRPVVGADGHGGFVVVWEHEGNVMAQRFDAAWRKVGDEMVVNPPNAEAQEWAALAVEPDGSFLVAWTDTLNLRSDLARIQARRFDAGAGFGHTHQVNVYTTGIQAFAAVAQGPDGGFLVTWVSYPSSGIPSRLWARFLDPTGTPVGDELMVSDFTTGSQWIGDLERLGDGYLAIWADHGDATHPRGLYAREIASDGTLGEQRRVDAQAPGTQHHPRLATTRSGELVMVWNNSHQNQNDVFGRGLARMLFADGFESGDLSAWH